MYILAFDQFSLRVLRVPPLCSRVPPARVFWITENTKEEHGGHGELFTIRQNVVDITLDLSGWNKLNAFNIGIMVLTGLKPDKHIMMP
jgi:hypothetical protein